MQIVSIYNMTAQPVAVRGVGVVSAESRRDAAVNQITFDDNFQDYMLRAPSMGVLFVDPAGTYAAYAVGVQTITGVTTLANTTRAVAASNAGVSYAITMMGASAVPADTIVYFVHTSGNALTVQRGGTDTIDGLTAALPLNATPNTVLRLQSDGVSNWTSV